jgi:3-deoxy-D-manno-octulosonic acid kinase
MSVATTAVPNGFVGFAVGPSSVVCARHVSDAVREALSAGTLYQYAEQHPRVRPLAGRGIVYAVPLPNDVEQVVIRHNRHGGLLAPLTRDLFRAPTRAPAELRISEQLRKYGIPTPAMLGYVIYDGPAGFKRVDVITREVQNSFDLSTALMSPDADQRAKGISAAADAVVVLGTVGARHHDLNVKNILLHTAENGALAAFILDVDRVVFEEPEMVFEENLARLLRSARKWQAIHGAPVTDSELAELAGSVRERRTLPAGDKTAW